MYFKETEKKEMLANCVFEMADFARTFLSAIGIGAANAQEPDVLKEKFERDAKKYQNKTTNKKSRFNFTFQSAMKEDKRRSAQLFTLVRN